MSGLQWKEPTTGNPKARARNGTRTPRSASHRRVAQTPLPNITGIASSSAPATPIVHTESNTYTEPPTHYPPPDLLPAQSSSATSTPFATPSAEPSSTQSNPSTVRFFHVSSGLRAAASAALPPKKISGAQLVELVLSFISSEECGEATLADFLYHLFKEKTNKDRMVAALLNGTCHSSHSFAQILDALLQRAIATVFRKNDKTVPEHDFFFTPGRSSQEHEHAHPALIAWVCELISELVRRESDVMISKKAGLHVRAKNKSKKEKSNPSKATTPPVPSNVAPLREGVSPEEMDIDLGAVREEQRVHGVEIDVGAEGERARERPDDDAGAEAGAGEDGSETSEDEEIDRNDEQEDDRRPARPESEEVQDGVGADEAMDETEGEKGPSTASRTADSTSNDRITWGKILDFSHGKMQRIARRYAPIMWMLINVYTAASRSTKNDEAGRVVAQRVYRPDELVCINALMSLTFGRSNRANLYPMCRGIWLFAVMASKTTFRVESRLAQTVVYQTVLDALYSMARAQRKKLRALMMCDSDAADNPDRQPPIDFWDVSDNVQFFRHVYDQRFGNESGMVTGYWGTMVRMADYESDALLSAPLVEAQDRMERKQLSVNILRSKINHTHLDNISWTSVLRPLLEFDPNLSHHKAPFEARSNALLKVHQIPETRETSIIPFSSNSANEMTPAGMKQAIEDHFAQRGISRDTHKGRIYVHSGDGKTFDMYLKLKKYLSTHENDIEALRCMLPMLETWHTKWTDLSRTIRASLGKDAPDSDPSTLKAFARETNCKIPTDPHKVDFYEGKHLLELAFNAHILLLWECVPQYIRCLISDADSCGGRCFLTTGREILGTHDLLGFFAKKAEADDLPSLSDLEEQARTLAARYTTTKAWERVMHPIPGHETSIPRGSDWVIEPTSTTEPGGDDDESDEVSVYSTEERTETQDTTLANNILFLRNAIWWLEFDAAIRKGDTGRMYEIMKIWIFTFAGSGNPYYCQYLLELFCNFEFEFSPALRTAILNNWLAKFAGRREFKELDLMQEHFNFWLETLAQHKGKEFDDKFYREILSVCVHHFMRLKDEMEEAVDLKRRSRNHGAPHLDKELRHGMNFLRRHEAHRYRPGRSEGFMASDDFARGKEVLEGGKLRNFVTRTTLWREVQLGIDSTLPTLPEENDDWPQATRQELPDGTVPPGAELSGGMEESMLGDILAAGV